MATPYEALQLNKNRIYPIAGLNVLSSTPVAATPTTILPAQYLIEVDSSAVAVTVLLPPSPYTGEMHHVVDNAGNANVNNITLDGNGKNINGASSLLINASYSSRTVRYNGAQWIVVAKV